MFGSQQVILNSVMSSCYK